MKGSFAVCLLLAALLAACGGPSGPAGLEPGETGRVVRVIDGDALVLDTGQSVRLVGLEAPAFGRDGRADSPHAAESRRMLEDMVLGRRVQLYYAGLTRDRYDRALAHLVTTDRLGPRLWVNREMIARGGARVRAWPDTARGLEPLIEAEAEAVTAGAGLWALAAYRVADARDTEAPERGFLIVDGVLGPAHTGRDDETACLRPLLASGLTVSVEPTAMTVCDMDAGQRVRVRGWQSGGYIALNAAENLSVRPAPALAGTAP